MRISSLTDNYYSKSPSFGEVLPSAIVAAVKKAEKLRVPRDIKGYKKDLAQIEKSIKHQKNNHVCDIGYEEHCDNFILINTETSNKIPWHSSKCFIKACEKADEYSKETHRKLRDSKITKWVGRCTSKLSKK